MNRFKKTVILLMAFCLAITLSACSGGEAEYESIQGFEFHFYPEEYEEAYSEVSKTLSLDADTDYQLQIEAACESGSMAISVMYEDEDEKVYIVTGDVPCCELLTIPANRAGAVTITVSIEPDTKGTVVGDLSAAAQDYIRRIGQEA